jgi:hypothetical protein
MFFTVSMLFTVNRSLYTASMLSLCLYTASMLSLCLYTASMLSLCCHFAVTLLSVTAVTFICIIAITLLSVIGSKQISVYIVDMLSTFCVGKAHILCFFLSELLQVLENECCRGNLETVAMGRLIGGARRWRRGARLGIMPTETPRFTQVQGPPGWR